MSKAEDLSKQYVLPFLDKHYEKYGEHKQMELSRFDGYDMMSAYEEGYHQAEKDLELSWEDIKKIHHLVNEVSDDLGIKAMYVNIYQETLKRFNKEKKKK